MSENSAIAWTDHTFNGWWSCTKVSAECEHCYAEALAHRFGYSWGPQAKPRLFGDHHWNDPIRWSRAAEKVGKRARVFCGSMCDVAEDRPVLAPLRSRLFELVDKTPWLDWLFLSKRPENFLRLSFPIRQNIWLGATVGTRYSAWQRIPHLQETHASVRFLSCEPLLEDLGPVDLTGIDWVIAGCESGPSARPMPPGAVTSLWMQARLLDIPFFFKQAMVDGRLDHEPTLNGKTWRQFPQVRP